MGKDIFARVFNSNLSDGDRLINDDEKSLASFVFDVAYDEINDADWESVSCGGDNFDTDSIASFDLKIDAAMTKFHHVIEVFKRSDESKRIFLNNFVHWSQLSKASIESLRKFAEEMQKDKFNSDIARVVGGVVGTIGSVLVGLSFLTPLAAVTIPLAIGGGVTSALGGGVVVGTTGTEIVLVKNRLEKVKALMEEEKERFSSMTHWFSHPEEVENALNSLIDYDIIKKIAPEVQKFINETEPNMSDDEFKNDFKQMLKRTIEQMNEDNKLTTEYGRELAPVVITFVIVVCLLKDHNRIVLDCIMITQRLAVGLMSVLDIGVLAGALLGKLAAKGVANAVAKFAVAEIFTCISIVIDVLNVILSSIDLHKQPETVHTKKINEIADKFENVFLFIEGVYNETKKYKSPENQRTTVIVWNAPDDAERDDIKMAIQQHLPKKTWGLIKLKRLEMRGNNWLVKIPKIHSQLLLHQSRIFINGTSCEVTE